MTLPIFHWFDSDSVEKVICPCTQHQVLKTWLEPATLWLSVKCLWPLSNTLLICTPFHIITSSDFCWYMYYCTALLNFFRVCTASDQPYLAPVNFCWCCWTLSASGHWIRSPSPFHSLHWKNNEIIRRHSWHCLQMCFYWMDSRSSKISSLRAAYYLSN